MRATKHTWGDPLIVPTLPIFRAAFLYMSRLVAKPAAANFSPFAKLLPVSNVIILLPKSFISTARPAAVVHLTLLI